MPTKKKPEPAISGLLTRKTRDGESLLDSLILPTAPAPHAHCQAMETELRLQITDQRDELQRLRTRENDLLDRILYLTDPRAYQILQSTKAGAAVPGDQPAPARPTIPNDGRNRTLVRMPGMGPQSVAGAARSAGALLTPEKEGFGRAGEAAKAESVVVPAETTAVPQHLEPKS